MGNFRVELHREQTPGGRRNCRDGAGFRACQYLKAGGSRRHQVPVAHPDLLASIDPSQDGIGAENIELSQPIFAAIAFLYGSTQRVGHQLLAVANPQHRQPGG